MAKFLTGTDLTNELCSIIRDAKKQLLIVSPYIKLDSYFKDELFEKLKANANLHILVAFGKNKRNPTKSVKEEDINYFKAFPNISIVYIENLHAKYYANEKKGLITSVNLYDYSFDNNVEFGVVSQSRLIGGTDIDKEAWNETMNLLARSHTVFVRRPTYKKKFMILKDYLGSETKLDITEQLLKGELSQKVNVFDYLNETFVDQPQDTDYMTRQDYQADKRVFTKKKEKQYSATSLGKLKGKSYHDVIRVMQAKGLILDKDTITTNGKYQGISYKQNKNGDRWIVYPESLSDIL